MKKKHLTITKKTLSVFLAVLMLMTSWVFFPGMVTFEASAAATTATAAYNLSLVNGFAGFNNNVTTIWNLSWAGIDRDYKEESYKRQQYVNVLYSSDCGVATASTGSVNLKDSGATTIEWYHGATTFLYDGASTPQTGVMVAIAPKGTSYNVRTYASYISSGDGLKLKNNYWYASDTSQNFMWVINAPGNTGAANASNTVNATNAWTINNKTWLANNLQFIGALGANEFYKDITVEWTWKGNQKSQDTGNVYTYSATSDNHIYVINWKSLKEAYARAQTLIDTVKANPGKYSTASVKELVDICNALRNAHPNNYVTSSTNNPSGYGTAASNAVSRLNGFTLKDRVYDVTFENMFSIPDWANSQSFEFNSSKGEVTVENNNTIKILKSIVGDELTTGSSYSGNHSANRYSMPVIGGMKYTVKYDIANTSVNGVINSEVYLFWYKADGTPASTALSNAAFNGEGTHKATFTAPADAAMAEIRFDNNCPSQASTIRFMNIAVYPEERAAANEMDSWGNRVYAKIYTYKAALGDTLPVPTRENYKFLGWYLDSNGNGVKDAGEEVTDGSGNVTDDLRTFEVDAHYNLCADWIPLGLDLGYDNMFSLADWSKTDSKKTDATDRGEVKWDLEAGTVTVNTTKDGEVYTKYGSAAGYYQIPVVPGTGYVFEADMNLDAGDKGQMFVFFYDASGNSVAYGDGSHIGIYPTANGTHKIEFTAPAGCARVDFRFGATDPGTTATYSNIGFYKKAVYDAYAKDYAVVRVPFEIGDTTSLGLVPTRSGYKFAGWVDADGNAITSVAGLTESTIVYATWTQLFKVTFKNWNGNVLTTVEVAPGAAAKAPANPSKAPDADHEYAFEGWDTDFSDVQSDLTVTATFTEKEHGNIEYQRITAATCTTPGKITKVCRACDYAWNNGASFEDTTGEYAPALGHTFERTNPTWTVLTDGAKTEKTHTVKCNVCDATTTMEHDFKLDANHPASDATCKVPGETYYKCACLEEKTETGSINPNNHVRTELKDEVAAECEKPGYTGDTWCLDCNTKIKTGSATEALEHVYTTYIYNDDAKCGVDGTETATCDLCNTKTATRIKAGSALEHQFTNYVDQGDATCDKEGTEIATCDREGCNETDSRSTGKKREHKFDGTVVKNNGDGTHSVECSYDDCSVYDEAAECSSWTPDGENCKCTVCGYTKAHTYGNWSQAEGNTGDAAGSMTRTCSVCGKTDTTACTYDEAYTPATCETDAYTTYTCKDADCGHGYTVWDKGSATGHKFEGEYKFDAENDKHQQACINGDCTAYGVGTTKDDWAECSWTYANVGEGKHTASCVCYNSEEQDCTGGEATCTAKAVCQFCDTAYGEKAAHTFDGKTYFEGAVKAKDATCTAQAEYYVYCSVCKDAYTEEETFKYGDLLAHTYTGNTEYLYKATEAECGVNETYYTYCSACKASSKGTDEEATFEKEGSALTHKFDGTTVCNDDGTHTITCSQTNAAGWSCTVTEDFNCADTADILGRLPADCLNAGSTMYQCKLCDYKWDVENEEEPALGHEYTKVVDNTEAYIKEAANCEHGTIYWYACKWCDANAKDETDTETYPVLFVENTLDKRAHDWKNVTDEKYLAEGATCFAAAWYYSSCGYADCAKSAKDVAGEEARKFQSGSALAHNWTEVEDAKYLVKEADCINDATYYYECSLCKNSSKDYDNGSTWAKENSKSGHAMTHTAANAATCDAAGNYEYWYCSTCKKYFKDAEGDEAYLGQSETVIKKRDHDLESFKATTPSCEVDGHPAYVECKYEDCDYTTYPEVLPNGYKATGHNFTGTWTYDEVHLYHSKLCANGCGKSGMVIDGVQTEYKVELDVVDYVIIGGEKCDFTYKAETTDGVHTHANSCVCGNGNTRVYSDEETFVETVAPTCTAKGYDSYACPEEDCDETWTKNEVAALNHLPAEKATSNNDGTHSVYCTREGCNYKISTEKCSGGTATCKDKAVCEKCGAAYGETTDHTFTAEWAYQNDATCGVNGTEKNTCDVCKTEVIREAKDTALEHKVSEYVYELPEGITIKDFDASALKEPTCAADGFAVRYCTLGCGYYQTKTVAKDSNAHVWETDADGELVWKDHQGDCATGVTMKNYCTVCGKEQKKTEAGEHKWEIKLFAEPNCVDKGYRVWRCSTCKFTFDEFYGYKGEYLAQIEALGYSNEDLAPLGEEGHSYINTGKNKPATCTESEMETWQCVHCDEYDYRDIEGAEALGHKLNHYDAQAADCVFEGNVEYYRCSRCDLMFADENATETLTTVTVPTTDHADNDGDGKCDECYRVLYTNEDGEGSCGCICHKENFLMRILYKILNFFWKLFKISKTCECGAVHW